MLKIRFDDVVWRSVDDELVIFELSTTNYLSLNGTARELWLGLSDGASEDDLVTLLKEKYQIPHEQARTDAKLFLSDLLDRGLLVDED